MRKLFTSFIPVLLLFSIKGQTFTGSGGSILNTGVPSVYSQNVSGLSGALGNTFGLEEICVDITHYNMNEVTISLMSPSGILVELVNSTSIQGTNFSSTCFNSSAATSITKGTAPFTGSFKPTGYIGRFNNGAQGNGNWQLLVKDYTPAGAPGNVNSWSLKFGSSPSPAVNLTSSNLPLVFVNTNSQAIGTSSILVDFSIIDNGAVKNNITDPKNGFNGKAQFNIRGNSSQIFEKKAFKVDLVDASGAIPVNAPLLGMPSESDWVLSPGYSDKTLMRNFLTQELFRDMGRYGPRAHYVELFINNEYFGVYTLIEKPKRNAQRVNVFKMTNLDITYPYITGGYIFQINRPDPAPNAGWTSKYPGASTSGTPPHFFYQLEYPKPMDITPEQYTYLKNYMDTFENVMNGPGFNDPIHGYRKYINVLTFVDFFIISELSKNIDAYKLSSFMSKDNVLDGGKLNMGPVWDFDIAWHNANYGDANNTPWWIYTQTNNETPIPTWWTKLMSDGYFLDMLACRWHTLRKGPLSNSAIHARIDHSAAHLNESQARNFTQFPILDAYIFPNTPEQISSNYQDPVNDLKNWVTNRANWMDANISINSCKDVALMEQTISGTNYLNIFPNPFNSTMNIEYNISKSSRVKIELINIMGAVVKEISDKTEEAGEHFIQIETNEVAAGSYILRMSADDKISYKKIIKTETQ